MVVKQITRQPQAISNNPSPIITAPKSPSSQQRVEEVSNQNSLIQTQTNSCMEFEQAEDFSSNSSQYSSSEDDSSSSQAEHLSTPPLAFTDSFPVAEQEQTQSHTVSQYSPQSSSSSITADDYPPRAKRQRNDTREEYNLEDQRTRASDHQEVEEGSLIVKIQIMPNTMVVKQIAIQSQPISTIDSVSTNPSSPLITAPKSPSSQQHKCAESELLDDTSHSSTTDSNSLPSSQESSTEDDSLSSSPDVSAEHLSTPPLPLTDSSPVAEQEQTQSQAVSQYSPQSSSSSATDDHYPPRAKRPRIDTREEYNLEDQRTRASDYQEVEESSQIVKIQMMPNTMVVQQITRQSQPYLNQPFFAVFSRFKQ